MFKIVNFIFLVVLFFVLAGCTQPGNSSSSNGNKETGYYKLDNPQNASPEEIKTASDIYKEINGQIINKGGSISTSLIQSVNGSNSLSLNKSILKAQTTTTTPINETISGSISGTLNITGTGTSSVDNATGILTFTCSISLSYNNFCNGGNYTIESGTLSETETGTCNPNEENFHVITSGTITSHKNSNPATKYVLNMSFDLNVKIKDTSMVIEGTYIYTMNGKTWTETSKVITTINLPVMLTLPFSDDFNRPNSTIVGNSWMEYEGQGDSGKINDICISNNELVLKGGYAGTTILSPFLYNAVSFDNNFSCTMRFKFSQASASNLTLSMSTGSAFYSISVKNNELSIQDINSTSYNYYTFSDNTYYKFVFERKGTLLTLSIKNDTTGATLVTVGSSSSAEKITSINLIGGSFGATATSTIIDYINFISL
jgi:hypothetical protein